MAYNVLIVDDSNTVRKMLIRTFSMTKLPVNKFLEADNGQAGLDLLKENWVDVIFLDINMPVMNGMEFMEHLRKNPEHSGTPVIVVSTEGSKERRDQLNQAGVRAYLRKPVTPEDLAKAIVDVLGEEAHA